MSNLTIQEYISTDRGRFSFIPGRKGFVHDALISLRTLAWEQLFKDSRAYEFHLGDELLGLSEHQLVDLLILCRNALKPEGSILFELSPEGDVEELEERLLRTLASLGLATHLLKTVRRNGKVLDYRPSDATITDPAPALVVRAIKMSDGHVGCNGSPDTVHVVGDSHIWFLSASERRDAPKDKGFGGLKFQNTAAFFKGFHLGAGLAYNLGKFGTTERCTEKLETLLTSPGYIPAGARIMISFGEIDCRSHVCRIAEKFGKPIPEVIDGIMATYEPFLINLLQRGYRPLIWAPVAPPYAVKPSATARFPVIGTFEQRMLAVRTLTERLQDTANRLGMPFLSILDHLVDEHGVTRKEFYSDPIHLGSAARPFLWDMFQARTGLKTAWSAD